MWPFGLAGLELIQSLQLSPELVPYRLDSSRPSTVLSICLEPSRTEISRLLILVPDLIPSRRARARPGAVSSRISSHPVPSHLIPVPVPAGARLELDIIPSSRGLTVCLSGSGSGRGYSTRPETVCLSVPTRLIPSRNRPSGPYWSGLVCLYRLLVTVWSVCLLELGPGTVPGPYST